MPPRASRIHTSIDGLLEQRRAVIGGLTVPHGLLADLQRCQQTGLVTLALFAHHVADRFGNAAVITAFYLVAQISLVDRRERDLHHGGNSFPQSYPMLGYIPIRQRTYERSRVYRHRKIFSPGPYLV